MPKYQLLLLLCLLFLAGACNTETPKVSLPKQAKNQYVNKAVQLIRPEDEQIELPNGEIVACAPNSSENQRVNSPDGRFAIYGQENPAPDDRFLPEWQIWIKHLKDNQPPQMIYQYYRVADVLWSPDSQKIAINDRESCDLALVCLAVLNKNPHRFELIKDNINSVEGIFARATKKIWEPYWQKEIQNGQDPNEFAYDHIYTHALDWTPDSSKLIIEIYGQGWGDGDGYSVAPYYYLYSLAEKKILIK